MDYIGSKAKLLDWMFEHIGRHLKVDPDAATFLDACAGSGAVSIRAAEFGFREIVSNDLMAFPAHIVLGKLALDRSRDSEIDHHIHEMRNLTPVHGFFSEHYSAESEDLLGRRYFTLRNGRLIDACRAYVDTVKDPVMQSYLLYCMLEALSRVCNTAGVHGAYLKMFKERAKDVYRPRKEDIPSVQPSQVQVFNQDILTLLENPESHRLFQEDVLYIDPPYTERQYAPNYHLYETLVRGDSPPIKGKTGIREWGDTKSTFCSKSALREFFRRILKATQASLVVVSYSSDGLLPLQELEGILMDTLHTEIVEVQSRFQRRFKADNKRDNRDDTLREYLLLAPNMDNPIAELGF